MANKIREELLNFTSKETSSRKLTKRSFTNEDQYFGYDINNKKLVMPSQVIPSPNFNKKKKNLLQKKKIYDANGKLEYEGQTQKGKKSGKGKLYYTENQSLMYQGSIENDDANGWGRCYYQNGKLELSGKFRDNKPYGSVISITNPDGSIKYVGKSLNRYVWHY